MECPKCGAPAEAGADECLSCGLLFAKWRGDDLPPPLPVHSAAAVPAERGIRPWLMIVLAGGIVAIVAIIAASVRSERATPAGQAVAAAESSPPIAAAASEAMSRATAVAQLPLDRGEDVGYGELPGMNDTVAGEFWSVRGRVIDMMTLRPVTSGRVKFSGATTVSAEVDALGRFSARLPKTEATAYIVSVEPPPGYRNTEHIATDGYFATQTYENRLLRMSGVPFQKPLRGDATDIEIALFPAVMSEDDLRKYSDLVRTEAPY